MEEMKLTKKEDNDGYEEKPEDKMPDAETRLDKLEKDVAGIVKSNTDMAKNVTKILNKVEDNDQEAEPKPKEEEKKKEDEEKPEDEKDKNKEGDGEKKTLPQAEAGETDEKTPISGNSTAELVAKEVKKAAKEAINELVKYGKLEKTQTPRPQNDVKEMNKSQATDEPAMDIIKSARAGTLDMAKINREARVAEENAREAQLKDVVARGRI